MNYLDFVTLFKNSKIYQEILSRYKTVGIYLTGSRILKLEDNNSDYNIVCLIDEEKYDKSFFYCQLEDCNIEIKNVSIYDYINKTISDNINGYALGYELSSVEELYVLYRNPQYQKQIQQLNEVRKQNKRIFIDKYVQASLYTIIEPIVKQQYVSPDMYTKNLYRLYYYSCLLMSDTINTSQLIRIKHVVQQGLNSEDNWALVQKLTNLYYIYR